jgi:hypothetical protein
MTQLTKKFALYHCTKQTDSPLQPQFMHETDTLEAITKSTLARIGVGIEKRAAGYCVGKFGESTGRRVSGAIFNPKGALVD